MVRTLSYLKTRFQSTDIPDGADFADLIDTIASLTGQTGGGTGVINGSLITEATIPANRLVNGSLLQQMTANVAGAAWHDGRVEVPITQTTHGFAVGNVVRCNSSSVYVKASAAALSTSYACGIVSEVFDSDTFALLVTGKLTASTGQWDAVTGGSGGLTAGSLYFLSTSVSGGIQTTMPSSAGQGVRPVLLALSTTSAVVISSAASAVSGSGALPTYNVLELPTAGTYNFVVPSGVTQGRFVAIGAGGGGGSSVSDASVYGDIHGGGGGGAGGYSSAVLTLVPGTALTLVVGAGGAGGAGIGPTGDNGSDGGASSVTMGATVLTANGGKGGAYGDHGSGGGGGDGGAATGGDTNVDGTNGADTASNDGGDGGQCFGSPVYAAGGAAFNNTGTVGPAAGAGGSGSSACTVFGGTSTGGNGAAGKIIIYY